MEVSRDIFTGTVRVALSREEAERCIEEWANILGATDVGLDVFPTVEGLCHRLKRLIGE